MKKPFLFILACIPFFIQGQNGGNNVFQSLNFSNSARIEGAGGFLLTIRDNDASLGVENPALLNKSMHGSLTMNYVNYFANSNYGFSSYVKHIPKLGTFNTSLLYANYGKFEYADVSGERNGAKFNSNDIVLSVGYGRELDSNFAIGGDVRFISSFLESYNAFGFSFDFGATYQKKSKGFGAAFLIKNLGMQLDSYTADQRENLPFNLIASFSKELSHAPFRFSFTYDNIQKWNLLYFNSQQASTTDPLTGESIILKEPGIAKKAMYHITIGTEMLLSKNFNLQIGYNYKNRQDLKVAAKKGATGISWGFGLHLKKIKLSYGMGKYHIAGTSNHITISTNIGGKPKDDGFYIQD